MEDRITYRANGEAQSFEGPRGVGTFRAAVIASALKLYANTGMKANRAYTPSAMLKAANEITGKKFKRGQYLEAAEALSVFVQSEKIALAAAEGDRNPI